MNNMPSYPHDSLKLAEEMVPAISITDTSNFTLSRLKNFILPIYSSKEDCMRVLHSTALPYSDSILTPEDTCSSDPFVIKNFKEAVEPRLDLLNLDELGADGLLEQDIAQISNNMLKQANGREPVSILLTQATIAELGDKIQALLLSLLTQQEFTDTRFKSTCQKKSPFKALNLICCQDVPDETVTNLHTLAEKVRITFAGICYARLLGNLPANIADPAYFAAEAQTLAATVSELSVSCHDAKFMQENNMSALLAVARGSAKEPCMAVFTYNPNPQNTSAPVCVIGKGLTFDSGGLSLKPGAQMDEMMFDKCGATAVFGIMYIATRQKLNMHLIGLASFTENMPDGNSYHPGDIITTKSGKTVEVLNTDAEGRMVLCDTITYAISSFNPSFVIDIATLTGACMVALGHDTTGFFVNGQAERLGISALTRSASVRTGDTAWQLPMGRLFSKMIEARFGDIANTGGRYAGAVTAAEFLKCFAQNTPWMHLDVAGTAWISGSKKNATGRPVALVSDLLEQLGQKDSNC